MTYTPYLAAIVATLALLAFLWAVRHPRKYLGPAADYWEELRSVVLPPLDRLLRQRVPGQHYAAYTLSLDEHVGLIRKPPEQVEAILWDHGFRRMPLAAYKTLPNGEGEVGSWAYRDSPTAETQVHVMLFRTGENGQYTSVFAHAEANPLNPFTALKHYRGEGYDVPGGERRVRELLPDRIWR